MQIESFSALLRHDQANRHWLSQYEAASNASYQPITRGSKGFVSLLLAFRASGGMLDGDDLALLLAEYKQSDCMSLPVLIASGNLFRVTWRNTVWIPMFQFELSTLEIKPECGVVSSALEKSLDQWNAACWMILPNDRLDDRKPVDLIDTDFLAVLDAAVEMGSRPSCLDASVHC